MAKVTYRLQAFDEDKVKAGALCVMVGSIYQAGMIVSITNNESSSSVVGVGICKYLSQDTYSLTINSTEYLFNKAGIGNYPSSSGYKLLLGVAQVNLSVSGNASKSSSTTVTTRGTDGTLKTETDYTKSSDLLIETLNARDEFALSALKELLSHVDNPSEMSNSEMNYYCNAAYRWAANMMEASANARGSFVQEQAKEGEETPTQTTTTRALISSNSLTSDTDKLLNNILNTLERTDSAETVSENTVYSKRVKVQFKELVEAVNKVVVSIDKLTEAVRDKNSSQNTSGE